MAVQIFPKETPQSSTAVAKGGILALLDETGQLPPVELLIRPVTAPPEAERPVVNLTTFLDYQFSSSILIPVDSFQFTFAIPDDQTPFFEQVKEGDIVTLAANNVPLAVGIIDQLDIQTDPENGERITVVGRDLMGQLEDQDSVSLDSQIIYANKISLKDAVNKLIQNTRIQSVVERGSPVVSNALLATEPGESKLSALLRFLEPYNCLAWMDPFGNINIGKPNMAQTPKTTNIFCDRTGQNSNVLSIKAVRNSTQIPNVFVPISAEQATIQNRIGKQQAQYNNAAGPNRLYRAGHRLPKALVVSLPNSAAPDDLSKLNLINQILQVTTKNPANAFRSLLSYYANRERARQNQRELIVQVIVPSHFNDLGEPFVVDTIYNVFYERGSVNEPMYLFQVDYTGGERGQQTSLFFCKLNTIVADIPLQR